MTDREQVGAMVSRVLTDRGGLDAVVLNANTAPPPIASLAEVGWEAFSAKALGELAGAFLVVTPVLPEMVPDSSGPTPTPYPLHICQPQHRSSKGVAFPIRIRSDPPGRHRPDRPPTS